MIKKRACNSHIILVTTLTTTLHRSSPKCCNNSSSLQQNVVIIPTNFLRRQQILHVKQSQLNCSTYRVNKFLVRVCNIQQPPSKVKNSKHKQKKLSLTDDVGEKEA